MDRKQKNTIKQDAKQRQYVNQNLLGGNQKVYKQGEGLNVSSRPQPSRYAYANMTRSHKSTEKKQVQDAPIQNRSSNLLGGSGKAKTNCGRKVTPIPDTPPRNAQNQIEARSARLQRRSNLQSQKRNIKEGNLGVQTNTNDHEDEHRKRMQKVTCIFAHAVEKIHGKNNIVQVSATKVLAHMNQETLQEGTNQTNKPVGELTQHGNITNNKQHNDADKEKAESENLEELGAEGEK